MLFSLFSPEWLVTLVTLVEVGGLEDFAVFLQKNNLPMLAVLGNMRNFALKLPPARGRFPERREAV